MTAPLIVTPADINLSSSTTDTLSAATLTSVALVQMVTARPRNVVVTITNTGANPIDSLLMIDLKTQRPIGLQFGSEITGVNRRNLLTALYCGYDNIEPLAAAGAIVINVNGRRIDRGFELRLASTLGTTYSLSIAVTV